MCFPSVGGALWQPLHDARNAFAGGWSCAWQLVHAGLPVLLCVESFVQVVPLARNRVVPVWHTWHTPLYVANA